MVIMSSVVGVVMIMGLMVNSDMTHSPDLFSGDIFLILCLHHLSVPELLPNTPPLLPTCVGLQGQRLLCLRMTSTLEKAEERKKRLRLLTFEGQDPAMPEASFILYFVTKLLNATSSVLTFTATVWFLQRWVGHREQPRG